MLLNVELVGPTEQKLNDIEAPGGAKKKKDVSKKTKPVCSANHLKHDLKQGVGCIGGLRTQTNQIAFFLQLHHAHNEVAYRRA